MPLVLARIDCRLIHGQVVETWVPHTKADTLVVANDDLAANPFLRSVMELAVPKGIRVRFCSLDEAVSVIADADRNGERSILLVSSAKDAEHIKKIGQNVVTVVKMYLNHFGALPMTAEVISIENLC